MSNMKDITPCRHKETAFRPCKEQEGFPGEFFCKDCGQTFSFDPNNPKGVRYLDEPNPKSNKELPALKTSKA